MIVHLVSGKTTTVVGWAKQSVPNDMKALIFNVGHGCAFAQPTVHRGYVCGEWANWP
jgi:hypothetical protein